MTSSTTPARLFGTDGIRGAFGSPPLDQPTVTAVGFHLASILKTEQSSPLVVLGGDTRDSTEVLCNWLSNGLRQGGARVRYGGVMPTPAVAYSVRDLGATAGIAVSASHNPHPDNGIKLFDNQGFKWSRSREEGIEALLHESSFALDIEKAHSSLELDPNLCERYKKALLQSLSTQLLGSAKPLEGLRVLLDTAQGAASFLAGPIFEDLGAQTTVLFSQPDGTNINRGCGSTDPQVLIDQMKTGSFDLGVAFDGDADRALVVDAQGELRDGDALLYLWASHLLDTGELDPATIVATSMSNLGLEHALARRGIAIERCGVGDREVVELLRRKKLLLGGEQSGHLIHLGLSSTGDGLLTALQTAAILARTGQSLADSLKDFVRFPQILLNVRVARKEPFEKIASIAAATREVESSLAGQGRLVLRYSGTEPLARVMIEGPDQQQITELAQQLAGVIASKLG
ncbi:MAG: phosphoglucosamine mutase [Deltaproteobacteria bacterium]|nr:phosphoglucosamine mutase [Deltaproteobacteria bacterium]